MVNPNPPNNNDDFYARAMASFNQQMALADGTASAEVEAYAKSLVEDDHPKIDSAVKSYLSLVAARSAVASDIDVISDHDAINMDSVQCTPGFGYGSRFALLCARTLLSTINSTTIPLESSSTTEEQSANTANIDEAKETEEEKIKLQLQNKATRVLWNRLVQSASVAGDAKAKQSKPSKVLGRDSLIVAYPFIQERFRRGLLLGGKSEDDSPAMQTTIQEMETNPLESLSNEVLPPVSPPKGIDVDQWKAFYTEFGNLLSRACNTTVDASNIPQSPTKLHDDSALLWSSDKGTAELKSRREMRVKRANEALSSVEDVKASVRDALSGGAADAAGEGV